MTDDDPDLPTYLPGTPIKCVEGSEGGRFLGQGWHSPEEFYTWSGEWDATLVMRLRAPPVAYRLSMVVSSPAPEQKSTFELFFNFFRLCCFELGEAETIDVLLPSQLFMLPRSTLVVYSHSLVRPSDTILGGDERRLGIALWEWTIG